MVPLPSPATSRIAFFGMYGSRITRLQDEGFTRILFSSTETAGQELHWMNLDGSGRTRLTNNAVVDKDGAWSPDGQMIAWAQYDGADYEIWRRNANGSGLLQLTNNTSVDEEPVWSPDGQKIAYVGRDAGAQHQVWSMNSDGSGKQQLTIAPFPGWATSPAWSPDGRTIAFSYNDGVSVDDQICTMAPDGTGVLQLTSDAGDKNYPDWSPASDQIAYDAHDGADYEIFTMNADGSGVTQWTSNAITDAQPHWSPDGRTLLFVHGGQLRTIRAPNGPLRILTQDYFGYQGPSWCPVATIRRTLIGSTGQDVGQNPPFGTARPAAIVGLTSDGLAAGVTIVAASADWPAVQIVGLDGLGTDLVGARITAPSITQVLEDRGVGLAYRQWPLPVSGAAVVLFDSGTGRISAVVSVTDTSLAAAPVAFLEGNRVILRGRFSGAFDAKDPGRNHVSGQARQVTLDARTGEAIAVR
jgi:hypothetical protein